MVYVKAWSESTPVGATTPADTIDTEVQDVKVALRERLEDFFPDWSADGIDPKKGEPKLISDRPKTRVNLVADLSLPSGAAFTGITWDAESYDIDDSHDIVTNKTRLVTKEVGFARIAVNLTVNPAVAGLLTIRIRKNAITTVAEHRWKVTSGDAGTHQSMFFFTEEQVAANDFFEIEVSQETGTAWTILSNSSRTYAMLSYLI